MNSDLNLNGSYKCWVQMLGRDKKQYNQTLNDVFTVKTIKQFWKYYQHMKRPSNMRQNDNIYIFRANIHPTWEADQNKDGGCLKTKIKKLKTNKQWQDLILITISPENKYCGQINGIRLKIKDKFDEVEIWIRSLKGEQQKLQGIKEYIKKNLITEDELSLDYKSFSKR